MKPCPTGYLDQLAFELDWEPNPDPSPCCGCTIRFGPPANAECACWCHDTARQFYRWEPSST